MKKIQLIASVLLLGAVFSCDKSNETSPSTTAVADENLVIMEQTEEVYQISEEVLILPFGGRLDATSTAPDAPSKAKYGCADVTRSNANNVVTVVVDYTKVKECNGKAVGGKMTMTFPLFANGKPDMGLFTRTIVYDNFLRNGKTMNGKHSVATTYENKIAVTAENFSEMTIKKEDGTVITFTSKKTRKTDTKNTPLVRDDDETSITGSSSGKTSTGKQFSSNITKALLVKNTCFKTSGMFPVSGTIEVKPIDKSVSVMDYGTGTCDLTYTITTDGKTETKTKETKMGN